MFGLSWLLVRVVEVVLGLGLVFNCLRGLLTQEWVYDQQSSRMMNASQLLGIVLGALLLADATGLIGWPLPVLPGCGG